MAPTSTAPSGEPSSTEFEGDDFSNNLFSDLAPLLTLFGEQVTKQFLSLTLGWADHILLAMGPLGIITIVVSAVRVSGPKKLKAVIGRAREGLTIAEAELLSSTSQDVCEMWNGSQIVRAVGEPKYMKEYVVLQKNETEEDGRLLDFKDAISQNLLKPDRSLAKEYVQTLASQPPNITLNVSGAIISELELWACVAIGVALQTAALVVIGLTVYLWKWQKGKEEIATYGYPCFLSGSLAVVIGILGCSYVIEKRTTEIAFHPNDPTRIRNILRLQKACTVGDQHFQSYAIMNEPADCILRTSRLTTMHRSHWSFLAATSTSITITGYIIQFVGLRALNWSATIIQLGVTLAMTCCRAWVRRGLASQPRCIPLEEACEAAGLTLLLMGDEDNTQPRESTSEPNYCQVRGWELHNLNSSFQWEPTAIPEIKFREDETVSIIRQHKKLCYAIDSPSPSCEWSDRLCVAIESVMKHITSTKDISIEPSGAIANKKPISWAIQTTREWPTATYLDHDRVGHLRAGVAFGRTDNSNGHQAISKAWTLKHDEIKSIMDLWAFSLNQQGGAGRMFPLPGGMLYHYRRAPDIHRYEAILGQHTGDDDKQSYLGNWIDTIGLSTSNMRRQMVSYRLRNGPIQLASDDTDEASARFQIIWYYRPVRQICAIELLRLFLSAIFSEISEIKGTTWVITEWGLSFKAKIRRLDRTKAPLLTNTAVSKIAGCLQEARLVEDPAEAVSYVVSALSYHSLLPKQPDNYPSPPPS